MLECADGSLYSGATTDPERRLIQHNAGRASRYTRSRLPVRLIYREPCGDKGSALRREAALKRLSASEKRRLAGSRVDVP